MAHIKNTNWFQAWRGFLKEEDDAPGEDPLDRVQEEWNDVGLPNQAFEQAKPHISSDVLETAIRMVKTYPDLLEILKEKEGWIVSLLLLLEKDSRIAENSVFQRIVAECFSWFRKTSLLEATFLPNFSTVEQLRWKANTTPGDFLDRLVRGGMAKDYYKDVEEHLALIRVNSILFKVMDTSTGNALFQLRMDDNLKTWTVWEKGTQISPDQFLSQVSDGVEEGLRFLELNLA